VEWLVPTRFSERDPSGIPRARSRYFRERNVLLPIRVGRAGNSGVKRAKQVARAREKYLVRTENYESR